ncbi:MAG: bifunctional adenosylcobinamide kinase/adenosylcobinamide-phosphate guanylyltransferase [Anaerolineae bacterium]|nr:bifunctional adenosylcobinamide kinase/adenosylcobinamide-phosphate guanylyltransferase [Anaerolineae bacterium]
MANDEPTLTLILGGARSGKSDYAEALASRLGRRVLYVATAEALDDEMRARVAAHQARRPAHWHTLEVSRNVGAALLSTPDASQADVLLLDCLTLLVSNILLSAGADGSEPEVDAAWPAVQSELDGLLETYRRLGAHLIVVSNEVGLGLVPTNHLGRIYRDCLGWANQALACAADRVILMVASLPLDLRSLPLAWPGSDAGDHAP